MKKAKKIISLILVLAMSLAVTACVGPGKAEKPQSNIDFKALVNKQNPLPANWEENIVTVHMTNSVGDDVEVETAAYDAYLQLKADLEEEGIKVDLDSARRSVARQQEIMDQFTKDYGADYAAKTVAKPGYSEHHTGLALDLYLIIDGKDVVENEDMIQYTDIWAAIHSKLADYGFILRYLEDKEHITGYGYEPWHIRYINDVNAAKEIMASGKTFEEYLGAVNEDKLSLDLGKSELFSEEELKEMAICIKCDFAGWEDCEFKRLSYAGDLEDREEQLKLANENADGKKYIDVARFVGDFHVYTPTVSGFDNNRDYDNYEWLLAKTEEDGWEIINKGY